ncbi:MAG TPA: hypothetical protein VF456_29660 [Vicinamibacterales bacterium]
MSFETDTPGGNMHMYKTAFATIASAMLAATAISAQSVSSTATITGCVYQEKDVPGRAPNPAERIGILEDYILAEITPAEAAKPAGTTGVPKTYSMYKLEKAAGKELKAMVGKRVEVTGRIDAEAKDTTGQPSASTQTTKTDRIIGHDRIDLAKFEVSSIRAVSGSCPAKPTTER